MINSKNNLTDEKSLAAFIRRQVHRAVNREDGEVSQVRKEVFNSYYGKYYGNEEEGFSSYITRDVLTTVEWLLPEICKIFLSGKVVKLRAMNEGDEEAAEFEMEVLNDLAVKDIETWTALSMWIKDVLISPVAYCKVYVDETKGIKKTKRKYRGLLDIELAQLLSEADNDDDLKLYVEGDPETRTINSPQGPVVVFDCTVVREESRALKPVIEAVPPEQVLVDPDHTKLDLDDCAFISHYTTKTHSELRQMGFSEKDLEDVGPTENQKRFSDETVNRRFYIEENPDYYMEEHPDPSMRTYDVHDVHMLLDWDDDGIAERRRVVMVNQKIVLHEEVDYQPMVAMSAIPIPHKHIGMSIGETVMDIQKLKTQLMRQLLDNIARVNRGRTFVNQDALTRDGTSLEMMQDAENDVIPLVGPPAQALFQEMPNPIIQWIQPVIEALKQEQQLRSGVNPVVSLDPDVLQKATATGMQQTSEQLSGRVRHLVATFAEIGFKQVYLKMHYLLRTYVDRDMQLKVHNKWVTYNPAYWEDRDRVEIEVGLGLGNTQEVTQFALQLLGIQKELMAMGLVQPANIYQTVKQLIDAFNIGRVSDYFVDPRQPGWQPPQPPPDPNMEIAKAELMKAQVMAKKEDFEAQLKNQELYLKSQREQAEAQREQTRAQLDQLKAEMEAQKVASDEQFRSMESARKHELELSQLIAAINETAAKTRLLGAQTAQILVEIGQDPDDEGEDSSSKKLSDTSDS